MRFWRRDFDPKLRRVLKQLTGQLQQRATLTEEQVRAAVAELVDEKITPEAKAGFLAALAQKGETVAEIAAFARALREKSVAAPLAAATRAASARSTFPRPWRSFAPPPA